jgi:hypothetical protein
MLACHSLSLIEPITLFLSKLLLLQRMASNGNNGKHKMEEEAESSTTRKRLWLSGDDGGDGDSSDLPEEEVVEEVSSVEMLMNQLDTSEEKLYARRAHGILFDDDGDTPLMSSEPRTPESCWRSDEESSDDDDDFWM